MIPGDTQTWQGKSHGTLTPEEEMKTNEESWEWTNSL